MEWRSHKKPPPPVLGLNIFTQCEHHSFSEELEQADFPAVKLCQEKQVRKTDL